MAAVQQVSRKRPAIWATLRAAVLTLRAGTAVVMLTITQGQPLGERFGTLF